MTYIVLVFVVLWFLFRIVLPAIRDTKRDMFTQNLAVYTQAIAIKPSVFLPYGLRGELYIKMGEYHKAIADYTQAIAINPNDTDVYFD